MAKKKKTKKLTYPDVWLVFSVHPEDFGRLMGTYDTEQEAHEDCVGPAFRGASIVCYSRNKDVRPRREGQGPKGGWKHEQEEDDHDPPASEGPVRKRTRAVSR